MTLSSTEALLARNGGAALMPTSLSCGINGRDGTTFWSATFTGWLNGARWLLLGAAVRQAVRRLSEDGCAWLHRSCCRALDALALTARLFAKGWARRNMPVRV